jgi:uncharacterized protein
MVDEAIGEEGLIEVEVAYAKLEEQIIVTIKIKQGTTIGQAVNLSGLLARFPEISGSELKVGVLALFVNRNRL